MSRGGKFAKRLNVKIGRVLLNTFESSLCSVIVELFIISCSFVHV